MSLFYSADSIGKSVLTSLITSSCVNPNLSANLTFNKLYSSCIHQNDKNPESLTLIIPVTMLFLMNRFALMQFLRIVSIMEIISLHCCYPLKNASKIGESKSSINKMHGLWNRWKRHLLKNTRDSSRSFLPRRYFVNSVLASVAYDFTWIVSVLEIYDYS